MKDRRIASRDPRLVAPRRHSSRENELTRGRDQLGGRIGIVAALLALALFASSAWASHDGKPAGGSWSGVSRQTQVVESPQ